VGFAANSVLCRAALESGSVDAAGFTVLRLVSGAAVLAGVTRLRRKRRRPPLSSGWTGGVMLAVYAVTFSFAYVLLDACTGALVLFGAVQATMILLPLLSGTRLRPGEWAGVAVAFAGLGILVFPGVTKPSPAGFLLMAAAGAGWGVYSLLGRGAKDPLGDTANHFLTALPFAAVLVLFAFRNAPLSWLGVVLSVSSGALASGVAYAIWLAALRGLTAPQAGVVQLLVPVLAALGGFVCLSEEITLRLALSAGLILGGIFLALVGRSPSGTRP
jgi:drug/metabolite transporter (DMT)-like permease